MSVVNPKARQGSVPSIASQRQSQIPFVAGAGQLLAGDSFSQVVESSAPGAWLDLVMEQHRCPATELQELAYRQHVEYRRLTCLRVQASRPMEIGKEELGAVSLFPSGHTFSRRMQTTAEVVYLALDPMLFVRNASEEMPPRPEFNEQRQAADPILLHFARTLRQASSTGLRHDLLFGSTMALSLARHLLLRYCSGSTPSMIGARDAIGPRALKEAKDFIEAHLESGMTVGQIADAVRISPSHFSRIFRNATGRSPYPYVMELRMSRAKEMLVRGRCSLKEVTYAMGFADQSHFTREFRRTFGMTPKLLLEQPP